MKHKLNSPEKWVNLHGDYLFRYAISRLKDKTLAEDVVQETFLAALKARNSFKGDSSERTWLTGILKNKIIDNIRQLAREVSHTDIDDLTRTRDKDFIERGQREGYWKAGKRPKDWMVDESDLAEKEEFWNILMKCVSFLPRKMAQIFILREMEELESSEISNVLDLSSTNLRVMLYRARKRLRECLEVNWIKTKTNKVKS